MLRAECIRSLLKRVTDEPIIANLGPTTYELQIAKDRDRNFYMYGGMGLNFAIGLGVALIRPKQRVIVLDGDGSTLMGLSSFATVARQRPKLLVHIVLDNEKWAATGSQPTHTSAGTDLAEVAKASGIRNTITVWNLEGFESALDKAFGSDGPWCIVAKIEETGFEALPGIEPEYTAYRFRSSFD